MDRRSDRPRTIGHHRTIMLALAITLSAQPWLVVRAAHAGDVGAATCVGGSGDHCVHASIGRSVKGYNRITVSVQLCPVGTKDQSRCVIVPKVMVDTGSTGLRIQAGAVGGAIDAFTQAVSGRNQPLFECQSFVGAFNNAWGSIRRADVRIGSVFMHNLAIQFVNDPVADAPPSCQSDSLVTSNGTLGIGWHKMETLTFVAHGSAGYVKQDASDVGNHLQNPVSTIVMHDNGEVFDFGPVGADGRSAPGTITFGVNTDGNNTLFGSASYLPLDQNGDFTTTFLGASAPESYIDSGTPSLLFDTTQVSRCPGPQHRTYYYRDAAGRVAATLHENAGAVPRNGKADPDAKVEFDIAPAAIACDPTLPAVGAIAQTSNNPAHFVWGAPFFIDRRVFLVQGRQTSPTSAETGQLYAFDKHKPD